ncbi:hypothetical protein CapIbe_003822 [Capra ibex]
MTDSRFVCFVHSCEDLDNLYDPVYDPISSRLFSMSFQNGRVLTRSERLSCTYCLKSMAAFSDAFSAAF